MKHIFLHLNKVFCTILLSIMLCFSCAISTNNYSFAETIEAETETEEPETEENENVDYNIFIHKPTYSVFYEDKIYFVDAHDNYFKIYDTKTKEFSSNIIDLSDNSIEFAVESEKIVDAAFDNRFLTLLSSDNSGEMIITIISLKEFKIVGQLKDSSFSIDYNKISVKVIDNELAITLTPKSITDSIKPLVLFANINEVSSAITNDNETTGSETPEPVITENITLLNEQIYPLTLQDSDIIASLNKMLILSRSGGGYYLVFVHQKTIEEAHINTITYSNVVSKSAFTSPISAITSLGDDSNIKDGIINTNIMEINGEIYLLTTHTVENETESYSELYKFNVDRTSEDKIINTGISFDNTSNPYILTNGTYATYADQDAQNLTFVNIFDVANKEFNKEEAENPKIEIEYKAETEFVYQSTTESTELFEYPWSATSLVTIEKDTDLIFIGIGKINTFDGKKLTISDHNYCLYTFNGKNYLGYVKVSNLANKKVIDVETYPYPIFKVIPNTNLYSLPTKVLNDKITSTMTSTIIQKIRDNSRVEILDVICNYTSNNQVYLKVKVNNEAEGYIEQSSIIAPSDRVDFVITNCSVKENGTKVYIDPDINSTVIYILDNGYRVRINGARNTQTGYTHITFNDEYGNEFSGYIVTDYLTTDSWSTLQIIGLVLIAITLGLLILILIFRKKKIGSDGQLYEQTKKDNFSTEQVEEDNENNIKKTN